VQKGEIIADGPSTDLGDLALGRNVLVAFMPWNAYNSRTRSSSPNAFVRDDVFTSITSRSSRSWPATQSLGPRGDHPRHPERFGKRP